MSQESRLSKLILFFSLKSHQDIYVETRAHSYMKWKSIHSPYFSTMAVKALLTRDRWDQKFRYDIDTDTFSGSESILILIPILEVGLNWDRYWYWYQENVPGLILIPRLYLIRILPKPYKKCPSLWIDTGTDSETQKRPRTRPILIPKGLHSIGLFDTIPIFPYVSVPDLFHDIMLQLILVLWKTANIAIDSPYTPCHSIH